MSFTDHNRSASSGLHRSWGTLTLAFLALLSAPTFALDTGDIVVASTKGEVHFVVNGAERTLRAGSVLELPANLRTGRDGAVELRQGATSISVGPDTMLEFPALEKAGGPIDRVVQPRGNAFYDIGKRPGRKLRVETPFLVGVVKGTQFNVAALENSTTISLFEGLLEIRSVEDTDVVDLHAGEIARRDRGGNDISVLKMDGKLPAVPRGPAAPRAPAGTGGNNNPPAPVPAPASPAPTPANVEGDERFVSITTTEPGLRDPVSPRVEMPLEATVPSAGEATRVDLVGSAPAADVAVGVETVASSAPVSTGASVDLGVSTPGNGASVDVAVSTPGNAPNVDLGVSTPGNGANVDVAVSAPGNAANVDLGVSAPGNGASVDVAVSAPGNANVDPGVSTPGNGANVDVVVSTPVADVGADVDVGVSTPVGGGASVDVAVDTPAINAGAVVNLDNSTSPGADVSVAVETPLAGAAASVDLSVDTPAADVSLNVGGVNVGVGANVDLTSTPAADVVTNLDLGVGNDPGNNGRALGIGVGTENGVGNGNTNGNANGNGVVDTVNTVVEETESLIESLLKKPGKK